MQKRTSGVCLCSCLRLLIALDTIKTCLAPFTAQLIFRIKFKHSGCLQVTNHVGNPAAGLVLLEARVEIRRSVPTRSTPSQAPSQPEVSRRPGSVHKRGRQPPMLSSCRTRAKQRHEPSQLAEGPGRRNAVTRGHCATTDAGLTFRAWRGSSDQPGVTDPHGRTSAGSTS